ncbi:MAG: hypothetical protein MJZ32_06735 [Bacteroidaceae bacterium]|nr:hypothetical protein [Bacteroidaceae bacterium]
MKHLLTTSILLLCSLTLFAQKNVGSTGNRKAKTTTSVAPKQQKQTASKQKSAAQPKQPSISDPSGYENGHGYVDLGLSVKWATMNVGANKPSDYGNYYAWGETRTKSNYDWSTYFDSVNGSDSDFKKYALNKKTTLDLSDDAAHVNWGGAWRMPTTAEQDELREKCTWTWTSQNGVEGYKVVSKSNGNSIFLPAAGFRHDDSFNNVGPFGYYWSSSLYSDYSDAAYYFQFYSDDANWNAITRNFGFSVRAVCPSAQATAVKDSKQSSISSPSGYNNGYGYVDLGLSVKWATMNVGANKPSDYGNYYAWGETRTKSNYWWNTYFDSVNGSDSKFKKYATNKKTTLDLSDDAAYVNWGGSWRMPTTAEQDELCEKCTVTWTSQNGVKGYKVVSKSNGNSIFLPAAGYRILDGLCLRGSYGSYWSSSLYSDGSCSAYSLRFNSGDVGWDGSYRYGGFSVRGVCP